MEFDANYHPYKSKRNVVYAKNGMVATSQPLAAQVGIDILKKGGNAVDAAIATAACLTIVEPTANGIGGDAFAIVWMNKKIYGLNASGPSPLEISIEKVKARGHAEKMPTFGWIPVTVPGIPAAWAELSKKFGKLSFEEVLQPAIDIATEGFPISPTVANSWNNAFEFYKKNMNPELFSTWSKTFAPNNRAPIAGEIVVFKHHAKTLREIATTQSESFYTGSIAQKIINQCQKEDGFLTENDLAKYKPTWVKPIKVDYKGYEVWELPPNGQGVVALCALNILKEFNFEHKDQLNTYHKQIEALKFAFCEGKKIITDSDYTDKTKISHILSKAFAKKYSDKINTFASDINDPELSKGGTVYLCTSDSYGNMVSFIQSNYMGFGSGVVIEGTGISLQNRGADFSLDENHPNALAPRKKTYHTIIPAFLTKEKEAIAAFGVMGGYMQPQGHVQVAMNLIDFKLNPQAALDAPRFLWVEYKKVLVETDFPTHIAYELKKNGHDISITMDNGSFGRGQIIIRNPDTGIYVGATESRCDGAVAIY